LIPYQFVIFSEFFYFKQGFVVSDWGATHDSTADNANAGLDMEQPGDWILIGALLYGIRAMSWRG
jgi:hypothetical protein